MYHYDFSDLSKLDHGFGGFIELRAWDDDGHEVDIVTNCAGEGRWEKSHGPFGPEYSQSAGTLQYSLPRKKGKADEDAIRKELDKRLDGLRYLDGLKD